MGRLDDPPGASRPHQAGHRPRRQLRPRPRLRQDRNLIGQQGCAVRRIDGGIRRERLAWSRPAAAHAGRAWRRRAGGSVLQADRFLLCAAGAEAFRREPPGGVRR